MSLDKTVSNCDAITRPDWLVGQEEPSLVHVTKALRGDRERLFAEMAVNEAAGGLAATAAAMIEQAGSNEAGSFFTTTIRNLKWLDSQAVQAVLGRSDFDIRDLKSKPTTIYVVLPPYLLEEHKRFMRLFVNLVIRTMSQGGKAASPVLFLLDEFYALGTMSLVEKAAGLMAGFGVKLWPIIQNISQLQELYPKNWQAFFANAGAVQVFSVNDRDTGEELIRRMGRARKAMRVAADSSLIEEIYNLRETEELEIDVARETGRQIILIAGGNPLMARRANYDETFPKDCFNPDPDYVTDYDTGAEPGKAGQKDNDGFMARVNRAVPSDYSIRVEVLRFSRTILSSRHELYREHFHYSCQRIIQSKATPRYFIACDTYSGRGKTPENITFSCVCYIFHAVLCDRLFERRYLRLIQFFRAR